MWWQSHYFADTDNAFVSGHLHPVSSRISGVLTRVVVEDNQVVQRGDLLAELDPADQLIKVEEIEAQITSANRQVMQVDAQIRQTQAQAAAAVAQVKQSNAQLQRAQQDAARYNSLYDIDPSAVSKAEVDAANATQLGALADLDARRSVMLASQAHVAAMELSREVIKSQISILEVQLRDAKQHLAYNRILAQVTGRVGKRSMEVGARVMPGQQLAVIVQGNPWVVANFKETQIAQLKSGQIAEVSIDALPKDKIDARIDSVSPASGSLFSLLPPDNATGNFTKIVQRIPVKIVLNPNDVEKLGDKLRPGMSASVHIKLDQPLGSTARE